MKGDSTSQAANSDAQSRPSLFVRAVSLPWRGLAGVTFGMMLFLIGLQTILALNGIDIEPVTGMVIGLLALPWIGFLLCAIVQRLCEMRGLNRPPASESWRLAAGMLSLVGFSFLMLSLFILAIHAAKTAATRSQDEPAAGTGWTEQKILNGTYSISIPSTWEICPDPSLPPNCVHFWDRQQDLNLLVSATRREDSTVKTVTEALVQATRAVEAMGQVSEISETQFTEVDSQTAADAVIAGEFGDFRVVWYIRLVAYPDTWLEVRLWAVPSKYTANETTFARIASSLRRRH